MFAADKQAYLFWRGRTWLWSFDGYTPQDFDTDHKVTVLTPAPVVEVFRAGYRAEVHVGSVNEMT